MAKHVMRIIVFGAQSVGRAFAKAVKQEIEASRQAARAHASNSAYTKDDVSYKGMSLNEAQQILNIKNLNDSEEIQSKYDHLFRVNDKSAGGSFYLQSKVFRAKERIDKEIQSLAYKEEESIALKKEQEQ